MGDERLTVDDLLDALDDLRETYGFRGEELVSVRLEGSPSMPVERVEATRSKGGKPELAFVLPAQPTEDASVDFDFSRLCEKVMRGESVIFQVRFGMDLFRECNATTPDQRMKAMSMYFAEAKRRVDGMIQFADEAGRLAEEEDDS